MTQAQSPFLPSTRIQFAWDSTSIGYFKTCPRLYQYVIINGWVPHDESIHLRFGGEFHLTVQDYEVCRSEGLDHEASIHFAIAALMERTSDWVVDPTSKPARYKNRDSLVGLMVDYFDHYGESDPAQTYIKADGRPAVELSFRFELDFGPLAGITRQDLNIVDSTTGEKLETFRSGVGVYSQPYLLCGHLDRVVTFNDQLLVMDHKTTTKTLSTYWFDQWEPNNQMTLYTLAGKVVLNAPIRGVIISGAQLLLEEPNRFVRGFTYRTQDQLDEWLGDLSILLRTAETYAEANYWPMNDTACDKYGGCQFRGICSKAPSVREKFLAADFTQLPEDERWNPLKPR